MKTTASIHVRPHTMRAIKALLAARAEPLVNLRALFGLAPGERTADELDVSALSAEIKSLGDLGTGDIASIFGTIREQIADGAEGVVIHGWEYRA